MNSWLLWVAGLQGVYYVLTGVWPLVHIESFMRVTGPKHDRWLVQTVGVLVTVIGAVLILAAMRSGITTEVITLAIASAAGLSAVDGVFVLRRIIPPIYLLDALAELILMIGWIIGVAR